MTTATLKNTELVHRASRKGITLTHDQAATLRRAERTLQRWAERECGDGSNWHIERNDETCHLSARHPVGTPFDVYNGPDVWKGPGFCAVGARQPHRIPDREAGAIRRVAALCRELGIHYYHQTDPRGCMLWIGTEPLTDQNYHNALPCCE